MNIDNVRLRDIVTTFPPASGMLSGRVVGIDTQGPAIIVRWDGGAIDVYSENSPVWASCTVEREGQTCESCGAAIMADESGCPSCGRKNLNEATFVEAFDQLHGATLTAIALDAPLVTQCPDCGADVPTIFEHVGGCPEQPASTWPSDADGLTVDGRHPDLEQFTCNHDGVNTESLAEQEVLAQHGFAIIAQSGVEAEESDLVPLAAPGSAFNVLPTDETTNYVAEGIGLQQACTVCRNHTECDGSCQRPPEPAIKLPWGE